jgi:hypothetical protein
VNLRKFFISLKMRNVYKIAIPHRVKYWESIADNLSKAGWSWPSSQPWIPTGERSGLQTRIARTESVSLCMRTRS